MAEGKIIRSVSGFYDVKYQKSLYRTRARGNFRNQNIKPVVGDNVEFEYNPDQLGYITKILSRKNSLKRPPIANVDQSVVVSSIVEPEFSSNLLDKILIVNEKNSIDSIIYFSKFDIAAEKKQNNILEVQKYYGQYYQTFNSGEENVVQNVIDTFTGKTTVFTGQSGAGKSTLMNKIDPNLNLKTDEISQSLNRGKHTTREVNLYEINDGLVADTPGFSSISLDEIEIDELPSLFPDFLQYSVNCKYRGCSHVHEPNCAVKDALHSGEILQSRYDNYLLFREDINGRKKIYSKESKK